MADKRECYVGDLTSDAIGKTVTVTYEHGHVTSTVTDVLVEIKHKKTEKCVESVLYFKNTTWRGGSILMSSLDAGLSVPHTTLVEVTS